MPRQLTDALGSHHVPSPRKARAAEEGKASQQDPGALFQKPDCLSSSLSESKIPPCLQPAAWEGSGRCASAGFCCSLLEQTRARYPAINKERSLRSLPRGVRTCGDTPSRQRDPALGMNGQLAGRGRAGEVGGGVLQ